MTHGRVAWDRVSKPLVLGQESPEQVGAKGGREALLPLAAEEDLDSWPTELRMDWIELD